MLEKAANAVKKGRKSVDKMNVIDYASTIFYGESLEEKLLDADEIHFDQTISRDFNFHSPGRNSKIEFSQDRIKFPKGDYLFTDEGAAIAIHSFANHELLAIEIMAMCLLKFEHKTAEQIRFKRGLIKTLRDEQRHFKMYVNLLKGLGKNFGDYPRSDFFWKWSKLINSEQEYLSIMAITFEGANLDFAHYYAHLFKQAGRTKIAAVLDEVFKDEITHVAFGSHYLSSWRNDKSLWDYYCQSLPFPITPARAKGMKYYKQARLQAGLDLDFANQLEAYQDNFQVTNRKQWKNPTESI